VRVDTCKEKYRISERRACALVGAHRSMIRYRSCKNSDEDRIIRKIQRIAYRKRRFGYRQIWRCLRREGELINHKKVYRLYKQCGLKVLIRSHRRKKHYQKQERIAGANHPNQYWAIDFVHDRLMSGRSIRMLTIIDVYTRECLRIAVATSMNGKMVTEILQELIEERNLPVCIISDNGTEFTSCCVNKWVIILIQENLCKMALMKALTERYETSV